MQLIKLIGHYNVINSHCPRLNCINCQRPWCVLCLNPLDAKIFPPISPCRSLNNEKTINGLILDLASQKNNTSWRFLKQNKTKQKNEEVILITSKYYLIAPFHNARRSRATRYLARGDSGGTVKKVREVQLMSHTDLCGHTPFRQ